MEPMTSGRTPVSPMKPSRATCCRLVLIVWIVVMLVVFLVTIGLFRFDATAKRFTNYALFAALVFYTATLGFGVQHRCCGTTCARCSAWIVGACYWTVGALVAFVFFAIVGMLCFDADIFEVALSTSGVGVVFVGNDVKHIFPVLAFALFTSSLWSNIVLGTTMCCARARRCNRSVGPCLYVLYALFFGQLVLFSLYLLVLAAYHTDIETVYMIAIGPGYGYLGLALVGAVYNGGVLWYMYAYEGITDEDSATRELLEAQAALATRDELFGRHEGRVGEVIRESVRAAARAHLDGVVLGRDVDDDDGGGAHYALADSTARAHTPTSSARRRFRLRTDFFADS